MDLVNTEQLFCESRLWKLLLKAVAVGAITFIIFTVFPKLEGFQTDRSSDSPLAAQNALSSVELQRIFEVVSGSLSKPYEPTDSGTHGGLRAAAKFLAYANLREDGRSLSQAWGDEGELEQAIAQAITNAKAQLKKDEFGRVDAVELDLAYAFEPVRRIRRELPGDVHAGVLGIQVNSNGIIKRWAPTEMLATNRTFTDVLKGADHASTQIQLFSAHQLLIRLGNTKRVVPMFRGNELIAVSDVDALSCAAFRDRLASWMRHQLSENGRMVYKYWPSRGQESNANNAIRQFMGTICLQILARESDDLAFKDLVRRNLQYNLEHFYEKDGDLGYINDEDDRKLGAIALAALAIKQSEIRDQYRQHEDSLRQTVMSLFRDDGSFQTYAGQPARQENVNFYPGEALLLWAYAYDETPSQEQLESFMAAFRYYREWHAANRNPAFVPWHTMAYFLVWSRTHDPELAEAILRMNEWLVLTLQQWSDAPYEDLRGHFYGPEHPEYGPSHVSSTGVYLEGLVDAFELARSVGDAHREELFRVAILRALRSAMQLEFRDDVDLFYVSRKRAVQGGLRTTPYDNEIRIDNVQHVLMAVIKILRTFHPEDYASADASASTR